MTQKKQRFHFHLWLSTTLMIGAFASSAYALEEKSAVAGRAELSEFNSLLDRTGTGSMLQNGSFTIFAPVNRSFNELPADRYPYLYTNSRYPETREWTSYIAQNHIVRGEAYLQDATGGGFFAVNGRFIPVLEAPRGTYYVDGREVLSMRMLGNGILYEIDGVIAKPWELVEILPSQEAPANR